MDGLPPLKNKKYLDITDGEVYLNFGKHKGELLSVVALEDKAYLEWMVDELTLDDVTDEYIQAALGG